MRFDYEKQLLELRDACRAEAVRARGSTGDWWLLSGYVGTLDAALARMGRHRTRAERAYQLTTTAPDGDGAAVERNKQP